MARITIDMPTCMEFSMEMVVPIAFINRGNHLGNDSLVSCLNEARLAFMQDSYGDPYQIEGCTMINGDLAVVYKSEAFHAERLRIEVTASDPHRYGCDFLYRMSSVKDGRIIALAKTGMLLFDFERRCLHIAPDSFFMALGLAYPADDKN